MATVRPIRFGPRSSPINWFRWSFWLYCWHLCQTNEQAIIGPTMSSLSRFACIEYNLIYLDLDKKYSAISRACLSGKMTTGSSLVSIPWCTLVILWNIPKKFLYALLYYSKDLLQRTPAVHKVNKVRWTSFYSYRPFANSPAPSSRGAIGRAILYLECSNGALNR